MSHKEVLNKPSSSVKNGAKVSSNEEEIAQGLTIQQSWQERPEISTLVSAILRLCRLSPLDTNEEWNFVLEELDATMNTAKSRASRKVTTLRSRKEDCIFLIQQQLLLTEAIKVAKEDIESAKQELLTAKKNRKNREEYERMAKELSKRSSLAEITTAKQVELQQKLVAEEKADRLQKRIDYRQRQAAVVLQAADDFRKALAEPIPGGEI